MRALCALCLVLCSALLGLGKAGALRRRCRQISELETGLLLLRAEICERRAPLPELCRRLAESAPGLAGELFSALDRDFAELDRVSLAKLWSGCLHSLDMAREERSALVRLGAVLGRYDAEGQAREIELCLTELSRLGEEARRQAESGGRLYAGLGLTLGIMAAVILI